MDAASPSHAPLGRQCSVPAARLALAKPSLCWHAPGPGGVSPPEWLPTSPPNGAFLRAEVCLLADCSGEQGVQLFP